MTFLGYMMKWIKPSMAFVWACLLVHCTGLMSCSDNDSFTSSRQAQLTFSTDSVLMDTIFSTVGSRTYDFWVYNRASDGLRLQSVRLRKGNQTGFRVNVDGAYLDNTLGSVVTGLEVRKGDSIRVFVELTAPENGQTVPQMTEDDLVFLLESGVEQRVCLRGWAWDAVQLRDVVVARDSVIQSQKPVVIYGGLRVDSAATLTIRGTTLFFHDKAGVDVYGRLITDDVVLRGDRLDHMFDYLPYDRVSGQWRGVSIHSSSFNNRLVNTEIRNAENGVVCDSAAFRGNEVQRLYMERTIVHNCKGAGLLAFNSYVGLLRCQFTNTLGDCVAVYGGAAVIDHCTLAQFYPFSADRGAALRFANVFGGAPYPLEAMNMTGCIVTGYADDVVMGERLPNDTLTHFAFHFENNLLRTPKVENDTTNFVNTRWETPSDSVQGKQHFVTIDEDNLIYDFHLDSLSTAAGLGCYE